MKLSLSALGFAAIAAVVTVATLPASDAAPGAASNPTFTTRTRRPPSSNPYRLRTRWGKRGGQRFLRPTQHRALCPSPDRLDTIRDL